MLGGNGDVVEVLAGEVAAFGDAFGSFALGPQLVEMFEVRVGDRTPCGAYRDASHVFDAAGDDEILESRTDLARREVDSLLARPTHPVELHAGHVVAPAGDHRREASDVVRLLVDRIDAAVNDVLDVVGVREAVSFFEC